MKKEKLVGISSLLAEPSIFKTPDLEKQYMDVYEAVLDLWNVP